MSAEYQAANIKAPQGDGTTNTTVRRFTVTTGSQVNAIPGDWAGKYVFIYNEDAADVDFFFTKNAAAAISTATAASAAGAGAATLGGRLRAGAERHVRLPFKQPEETLYFARIGSATSALRMELASD